MMTRAEAKQGIEEAARQWARQTGYRGHGLDGYPSWISFMSWLSENHYDRYLLFRTQSDPIVEAEGWFEAILKDWGQNPWPAKAT